LVENGPIGDREVNSKAININMASARRSFSGGHTQNILNSPPTKVSLAELECEIKKIQFI